MTRAAVKDGRDAAAAGSLRCVAVWTMSETACQDAAIGLFEGACVHEHVREGWLCAHHAEITKTALCKTCWRLPGGLAHECRITIMPVTP